METYVCPECKYSSFSLHIIRERQSPHIRIYCKNCQIIICTFRYSSEFYQSDDFDPHPPRSVRRIK